MILSIFDTLLPLVKDVAAYFLDRAGKSDERKPSDVDPEDEPTFDEFVSNDSDEHSVTDENHMHFKDSDKFVGKKDEDKHTTKGEDASSGYVRGLVKAAWGLLKQVGIIFLSGFSANPISNFAKNDTAVIVANKAVALGQQAHMAAANAKSVDLSSEANSVVTSASTISGEAKTAAEGWKKAIQDDFTSNKQVQKLADRVG